MLTASELLATWEKCVDRPVFERALLLLEATSGQSSENLAELSIGQRDARLLDLREALFGSMLPCLTACAACGEQLELNLDVDDLRVSPSMPDEQRKGHFTMEAEGVTLSFRLPNSLDLSVASFVKDADSARALLIERCLVQQKDVTPETLLPTVLDALTAAMAESDPQSHIELALTCPSCEQDWQVVFDIASYLWSEIQTWALRVLREVHILASVYGWREADILALSPLRRQLYLESVSS
ncbi:MAG: T4 family baseplate hub assembly chaperone [Methylobacter sp.]